MNLRRPVALIAFALMIGANTPGWGIFTSIRRVTVSASATFSGTALNTLSIQAAPLPNPAFFGKDVVIPVTVTANPGPINTTNLNVSIVYQLIGPNGGLPLSPPITVPVTFTVPVGVSNTLTGTAVISAADLQPIQNGGQIYYVFVARQSGAAVLFGAGGLAPAPTSFGSLVSTGSFQTAITNSICAAVGPAGGHVSAPDLFENDGQTGVTFPAGAFTTLGTLCITQNNINNWPVGPGGALPVEVYTITLDGTSLVNTAQLILSYPTDSSGRVLNLNADPGDLAIFWLGPENLPQSNQSWHILGTPSVDTTRHTVSTLTSHFSTFALFVPKAGSAGAALTRPTTRIITPNGDGINDTLIFASDADEVKIFDIRGRKIRTIAGPSPIWDGKDDNGKTVLGGVYIYQYTEQGERVSGVVGVAK